MDQSEMLSMSDEDFAKLTSPPEVSVEVPAATVADVTPAEVIVPVVEEQQPEPVVEEQVTEPVEEVVPLTEEEQAAADALAAEQTPPTDYEVLYADLLKPLRANGKDIQLKSHAELIQLAQQGANYTRKMQEFAPHRKTVLMLERNGINQDELDFLIAVHKKDPVAIQKLLKDSGVNPLDIDTEAEPTYQGGNHTVTDAEANFHEALTVAGSTESGQVVIQAIQSSWDQASKEMLFKQPSILEHMTVQKDEGFYDRIVGEMDRQRMLGNLPAGQNWLETYKTVGEQMVASGAFADLLANDPQQQQTPAPAVVPVATRVVAPKPQVTASAKAAAAAPSRTAAKPAQAQKNPLEMPDDEFMKQFANRL